MHYSDDNSDSPKKVGPRKKLVDLKAVAALLDDGEEGRAKSEGPARMNPSIAASFKPNEELIQATARIKGQRDLVLERMRKMDLSKNKVSRNVYEKVRRDYQLQLDSIGRLFSEKKAVVDKELKHLYMLREQLTIEVERHKEILEEARFRHHLDEFTEEQFKEVEEYESRELANLQTDLAQIISYIHVHEELFEPLPLETDFTEQGTVTKTLIRKPVGHHPSHQTTPTHPLPTMSSRKETSVREKWTEEATSHRAGELEDENTSSGIEEGMAREPTLDAPIRPFSEDREEGDLVLPEEKGYFQAESEASITEQNETHPSDEPVLSRPGVTPGKKEPESVFDVLQDLSVDGEVSQTQSKASQVTPTPIQRADTASPPLETGGKFKVVFTETEGELEAKEIVLKDNMSIGRSPSNDIVLRAPKVSRQHAAINKYKDKYIIIDLKSSNGVYINSQKIEERSLEEGDEISIGGYKMIFTKI